MRERIKVFLKNNSIFLPFVLLLLILFLVFPEKIMETHKFVDWRTIITLLGLLIITTGIKESSFLRKISKITLRKVKNERILASYLIVLSAVFSMVLTNDIALFIIVPLTISMQESLDNDLKKIVIFEAIAVNVGSALTPIGNPQNLFLWHRWNNSFVNFVANMFPLFLTMVVILLIFALTVFKNKTLLFKEKVENIKVNNKLFIFSLVLLPLFIVAIELDLYVSVLIIFLLYLLLFKKIILRVDYPLIILFIIMFIDFHMISEVGFVSSFIEKLNMNSSSTVFFTSLFSSQIMSNVPASIFVSKFSANWKAIAYGVSVGGNGLIFASLANIIAIRFLKGEKILSSYHKYSIIYLLFSTILVYFLFYLF